MALRWLVVSSASFDPMWPEKINWTCEKSTHPICRKIIILFTGVNKIGGITDHRPIYPQSLVVLPPASRTLRLMEAARKPLDPNITSARHFFVFHSVLFSDSARWCRYWRQSPISYAAAVMKDEEYFLFRHNCSVKQ